MTFIRWPTERTPGASECNVIAILCACEDSRWQSLFLTTSCNTIWLVRARVSIKIRTAPLKYRLAFADDRSQTCHMYVDRVRCVAKCFICVYVCVASVSRRDSTLLNQSRERLMFSCSVHARATLVKCVSSRAHSASAICTHKSLKHY